MRCDCRVMSHLGADAVYLLCSDWLIHYFLEFDWLMTNIHFFLNLDNSTDNCLVNTIELTNLL